MGKADIREVDDISRSHPEIHYRAFDLFEAGPDRIQEMLSDLLARFEREELQGLPVTAWNMRRAPQAFRFMSQARHIGKNVLRSPARIDRGGTVLITGGTGQLGSLVAAHLVRKHGVEHLLLTSRRGEAAPGAAELLAELSELGAQATVATCDVSDRAQLQSLLSVIPAEHPLTAVIHAAGVIDDGLLDSLTPERVDRVLASKVDAAWHLHELTSEMELSAFVMFSSIAATFGSAGQGSYAAANAFLDGLAEQRRSRGLAGTSIAWGAWEAAGGLTSGLGQSDLARFARAGIAPLSAEQGLALFDRALGSGDGQLIAVRFERARLRMQAQTGELPALLGGLVSAPARAMKRSSGRGSLVKRLEGLEGEERERIVLELVRGQVASVLGHDGADAVQPLRTFKQLGFDSLAGVELRNRLEAATGQRLTATLIFDYPTPGDLVGHLLEELAGTRRKALTTSSAAATDEPIAIVGMSCRYPGEVRSPEELWELVAGGRDAISSFPEDRGWDLGTLRSPDPEELGSSWARQGGFLYDAADFDGEFFGIGPREALAMDPQQRLLLEVCWEAVEQAGLDPHFLRGAQAGVFAGISASAYGANASASSATSSTEGYRLTGSVTSVATGRVAYALGLEGPAVSIDTACSSSLVALHLACQALRQGECSMALAGGVMVMVSPGLFVEFSRQRGLARDGRCKAFSEDADGTGWSEGAGMLLIERLSDAKRHGHPIAAVIRGSAVNQDGASNGLTAPNGSSQQRVIGQALANARVQARQVDAIEAHGTGTRLGDPIEAQALLASYAQDEGRTEPLWLGSIKSNIGHAGPAAGVAGVIKMAMALRHGVLPPTLHVERPSTEIDWTAGPLELLKDATPWSRNGRPRRAGISSFGISGTNAHVIVEEAPAVGTPSDVEAASGVPGDLASDTSNDLAHALPWVLSGNGDTGLRGQAQRLAEHLDSHPELDIRDVGLSLAGRSELEHRAVVLAEGRTGLLDGVQALAHGEPLAGVRCARVVEGRQIAFLFTGQGAQRAGMGSELLEVFPVFKEALVEVLVHLDGLLGRSLAEVMFATEGSREASLLDETAFTQPALFALEVALFRQFEHLGVRPDFLIGHSVGEITAACVAGALSLEDACKLVVARGRLMGALPAGGAMAAVQAGEEEVRESLGGLEQQVSIAAVNGPRAVVLSGERDAVESLVSGWEERGRKVKRLVVSHAFHSPRMDGMLEELAQVASGLSFGEPAIPIVSNLTGEPIASEQMRDPGYWARHARETVRFADGVRWLADRGVGRFVELGPDGVLSALCHECLDLDTADLDTAPRPRATIVSSLRRQRPEPDSLLAALADIWVDGGSVDWQTLIKRPGVRRVALPTYAFQRRRYWLSGAPGEASATGLAVAGHSPLGGLLDTVEDGAPMLKLDWLRLRAPLASPSASPVVLGEDAGWVSERLTAAGVELRSHPDLTRLGEAVDRGEQASVLLVCGPSAVDDLPCGAHTSVNGLLELVQTLLAQERFSTCRLVVVTSGAVAVDAHEGVGDLAGRAVWGFIRSAQLENPGRLTLLDLDHEPDSWRALERALGLEEPQLAIRAGVVHGARLVAAGENVEETVASSHEWIDPRGTVLITGGGGRLAGVIAAHLAREHGVKRLLLASRNGGADPGMSERLAQLSELGAQATASACDVSDRSELQRLLSEVSPESPLSAVVHTAGVIDEGVLASLTPGRVDRVLGAKADAAWHLHELTSEMELSAFVTFSSIAGTLGRIGQTSHAAASAFLDGLAEHRRSLGLAASSIAWGAWEQEDESTAGLGANDLARLARAGMAPLSVERGLALFDQALDCEEPCVVAARFEGERLRTQAQTGELPALLSTLVGVPVRGADGSSGQRSLVSRLEGLEGEERERIVLELVRGQVASVLGHDGADAIQPRRTFKQLGFDSLAGVELRNRLEAVTGQRLPATLIFDYPTPAAVAQALLAEIALELSPGRSLEMELDKLEQTLASVPAEDASRAIATSRLQALLRRLNDVGEVEDGLASTEEALQSASADEIYDFIDKQLGSA
jgi:acyl transferase domain-containing protein